MNKKVSILPFLLQPVNFNIGIWTPIRAQVRRLCQCQPLSLQRITLSVHHVGFMKSTIITEWNLHSVAQSRFSKNPTSCATRSVKERVQTFCCSEVTVDYALKWYVKIVVYIIQWDFVVIVIKHIVQLYLKSYDKLWENNKKKGRRMNNCDECDESVFSFFLTFMVDVTMFLTFLWNFYSCQLFGYPGFL